MYDVPGTDPGREWVEILNTGSEPVDLIGWKFLENDTASHNALSVVQGSLVIPAGARSLIISDSTKFLLDWPSYSGTLLKGSFSISNSTSTLFLKPTSGSSISQSCSPVADANGTGNSLQRQTDGTWIAASSTPGAVNSNTPIVVTSDPDPTGSSTPSQTESNQNNSFSLSSHSSYVEVSTYKPLEMLSVTIGRNRLASTGIPTEFEAKSNITVSNVNYHWTFGDGASAEGRRVEHVYEYAGDYVVVMNAKYFEDVSVSRTNIKVTEPKLSIEEANNSYIKIKNNSTYEINLYGWKLYFENKAFVFPIDTIILAGVSTEFSSGITGFHPNDLSQVMLSTNDKPVISNISSTQTTKPKVDQLSELYKKAVQIKNELASLETNEIDVFQTKVATTESKKEINLNNLASPIVSISSTTEPINNWFSTLKRFLFKRN